MFLLDTNIISETRKRRPDSNIVTWVEATPNEAKFISVMTIGELRRGIERIGRRDPAQARRGDAWIGQLVEAFASRMLRVDLATVDRWGRLGVPDPVAMVDGLIAATALVHGMTVVTRNVRDFERCGVATINPFG